MSIERLLPRHFKILAMCLAGHKDSAIAAALGMGQPAISLIRNSPIFQTELARRRKTTDESFIEEDRNAFLGKTRSVMEQAQGIVEDGSPKAAKTLVGLLDSKSEGVKLQTATKILDRVFGAADKKTESNVSITISSESAQLIQVAIKESDHASRQINGFAAHSTATESPSRQQADVRENGVEASGNGGSRPTAAQNWRSEENVDASQTGGQEDRREVFRSDGGQIIVGEEGEGIGEDSERGPREETS